MSWKTLHPLSNFLFFDKDILDNEAARGIENKG